MSASQIDLCLAATLASDLGVANDATAQRVVTAASRAIANFLGRNPLYNATWTEYPDGRQRPYLPVLVPPIVSVTSITEGGLLVASSEYEVTGANADAGLIYRLDGYWMETGEVLGNITAEQQIQGDSTSSGITLVYVGGWVTPGQNSINPGLFPTVTLPEDIQEAALQTAGFLYKLRGVDLRVSQQRLGDFEQSFFEASPTKHAPIPDVAKALLAPYRRYAVL